jgi:hypothetical protein
VRFGVHLATAMPYRVKLEPVGVSPRNIIRRMKKNEFEIARKWLADAPLFIDGDQVDRFFDAVVRPSGKLTGWTYQVSDSETKSLVSKIQSEVEAGGGTLVELWMKLKGKLGIGVEYEQGTEKGNSLARVYNTIDTPQRQLITLAEYYDQNQNARAFYVTDPQNPEWRKPNAITDVPRQLVFLDLPGQFQVKAPGMQTKLIPIAAEFENGKIVPFFTTLRAKSGENPPSVYPESQDIADSAQLQAGRKNYWEWFAKNFQIQASIHAIEAGAEANGRIRWIDFRLPIADDGDTLHLHISPAGRYDTGVFAYNFIRRGFEFGLRIVGTLKSDPDMDVLAIYDK